MELLRYIRRKLNKSDSFGQFKFRRSLDFDWYLGKEKIGIYPRPSTKADSMPSKAECFYRDFLATTDTFVIKPYPPTILRKNEYGVRIETNDLGVENTKNLIELLTAKNPLHAYISSIDEKCDNILTFSLCAPSRKLYTEVDPMQMILEEKIMY